MRIRTSLFLTMSSLGMLLGGCGGGGSKGGGVEPPPPPATGYRNSVLDRDFPDPAVIRVGSTYWAYATQTFLGNGQRVNIQVASSPDLVTWTYGNDALPTKPAWSTQVWNFWAPHVTYVAAQSRYIMYYSADADTAGMCIGIATSPNPQGPFTDVGSPLVCGPNGDFEHIDPMAFDDPASGKHYLYWGSGFKPISVQELADDRVHFAAGSTPTAVIPTSGAPYEALVEGPWLVKRPDAYYMFYSGNDCCSLPDPHYAVLVARSASPTGPFTKMASALGTGSSAILTTGDFFRGPGHNAIISDGAGADWIVYHAVDPTNNKLCPDQACGVRRPMLIDRIVWQANGWPSIAGGHPSHSYITQPTP